MIELLLIGGAAWFLAKRSKPVAGVGAPYQTYIPFDTLPDDTPVRKTVVSSPIKIEPAPVFELSEYDREADVYYKELADAAYRNRRFVNYVTVVLAFAAGAEDAEYNEWINLPTLECEAEIDSMATDWAIDKEDFDAAYDAYTAGALYVINK